MALEERLELSIDDALNSVGQLETALTSAASLFGASIAEALNQLDSLQIGTVDAGEVTTAIDAAVVAADLEPTVTADAAGVTGEIDAAVAAVDAQVTPTTDAGAVTSDIDAAVAAADATVPLNVDASNVAGEIDAALASADTTVTIEADTGNAVSEIDSLGQSAKSGGANLDGLAKSAEGFGIAAALGKGEVGALRDVTGQLEGAAGAAGLGLVALTGTAVELFHIAAEGQVAEEKFASSLGAVADQVSHVNIGGLNEDLIGLATRTGNAKDQLLLADAKIGDLGHSAGASDPQIAALAEQINAVAIRATTMNPNLGEAGDVADRLAGAFARGGRALLPFGIALTSTEINARALKDTGKDTASELTLFEKSAAGAAITTERLGDHLGTDINEGAKKAEVQIRSLKEEFHLALEELGKPLLDPVVRALREGEPLLLALAKDLGDLASAVLPLFAKGIEAIAPLVGGAGVAFEVLLGVVRPIVDLLVAIPTPVLSAVAAFFALSPVIEGAATALLALRVAMIGISEAGIAGIGPALSAAINPVTLVAAGLAALIGVFISQASAAKQAKEANQAYADQLGDTKKSIDATIFEKVTKAFQDQAPAVTAAGTSIEQLSRQVAAGKGGYADFLTGLQRTGAISEGVRKSLLDSSGGYDSLANATRLAQIEGSKFTGTTAGLVGAFQKQQVAAAEAAKTEVQQFAAQSASNRAAVEGATARNRLKDGTTDYLGVLRQVKPPLDAEAAGNKAGATEADKHAAALKALDDNLNKLIQSELGAFDAGIKLERAQIAVTTAAIALTQAHKDAEAATIQFGAGSDQARDANIKLHSAELDVEDSATKLAQANIDAQNKTLALTGASLSAEQQQHITAQAFRDTAASVGVDSPLGQHLIETANHLDSLHAPPPINVQVNTADANARLAELEQRLGRLGAQVSIAAGHIGSGFMAGGPFTAGTPMVVGEVEPELIVPNTDGWVFNQAQLRSIVKSAAGMGIKANTLDAPTTSVPPVVQHVTVNEVAHDPRATAFAVSARIGQGARR